MSSRPPIKVARLGRVEDTRSGSRLIMSDKPTSATSNEPDGRTGDPQALAPTRADRPPTPTETEAADRAARSVDTDRVAVHFEKMNDLGKNVKSEGKIESP